jgi:hypothetical protein
MSGTAQMTADIPYRRWHVRPAWALAGMWLLSTLAYLALIPVPRADGQLIGSDGVGYYVYARSLAIDHDLDFTNEYVYYERAFRAPELTPLGRPGNKYAIGPAILWMPFFLVAHALALLGQALGLGIAADGYGYLYQAAISVGSITYGALGFAMAYACARRMFSSGVALVAVGLLWFAGNAIYYMVFEPSMSHMVALFSVAALLTIWFLRFRGADEPNLLWAALLGVAGGLVLLVRLQDAPFLVLPYSYLLARLLNAWRAGDARQARRWLLAGLLVGACAVLVFALQLVIWRRLYGTWLTSPYTSDHDPPFYWLQPQVGGVLFSTFHGLFTWHPVYLLALAGLTMVGQRDLGLALGLLALLAIEVYIVAAWWAWWQGDSFGGRMFLSATWIWVLGLAGLVERLWSRARLRGPMLVVALLLLLWNGLSLLQYRLGMVPMSAPLTWEQMTIERIKTPWVVLQRLLTRS